MDFNGWGSERWHIHLSLLLNATNPPDRYRFDIGVLAKEFSRNVFPQEPITEVVGDSLDGFEGALIPSESKKRWGIYFKSGRSAGRQRFTVAHELGHYLLHRRKYPDGFRCNEEAVDARDGNQIEREANEFASGLLMPLDDFRKQIPVTTRPGFDQLGECANRYDVSLIAVILRWLRYTKRRSMIVVSRDGFIKWAWSSTPALKTGRYFKTSGPPVELPTASAVGQNRFTIDVRNGVDHPSGVWFEEECREMTIRSERYDLSYTLLHFGDYIFQADTFEDNGPQDTYERFANAR
jgi:hypothetical protein